MGGEEFFGLREKGEALIWLGNPKKAEKIMNEIIYSYDIIGMTRRVVYAKGIRIAGLIKLNKLKEAYEDCCCFLEYKSLGNHNLYVFKYNQVRYHAAWIKHQLKDFNASLAHFNDLFKNLDIFCKGFLEEKEYKELVAQGAFAQFNEIEKIPQCFANTTKIFAVILGLDHLIVKDYIAKNGKKDNWFKIFFRRIRIV